MLGLAREAAGHAGDVVAADPGWLRRQGVDFWMGHDSPPLWLLDRQRRAGLDRERELALIDSLR